MEIKKLGNISWKRISIIVVVVLFLIILLPSVFKGNQIYFGEITIPTKNEFGENSITKESIRNQIVKREIPNILTSAEKKLNEMTEDEIRKKGKKFLGFLTKLEISASDDNNLISVGNYFSLSNGLIKKLRKRFAKKDSYVGLNITLNNNVLSAKLNIETWEKDTTCNISMYIDSTKNFSEYMDSLQRNIACKILMAYSPIASILCDFNNGENEYEGINKWGDNFYSEEKRLDMLNTIIQSDTKKKYNYYYANILLANIISSKGKETFNEDLCSNALQIYANASMTKIKRNSYIENETESLKKFIASIPKEQDKAEVLHKILREKHIDISNCSQIILVLNNNSKDYSADLYTFQKNIYTNKWEEVFPTCKVGLGYAGFAKEGCKIEGDGKTPTGLFPISRAFGRNDLKVKLDYTKITPQHVWVTDTNSAFYNQIIIDSTNEYRMGKNEILSEIELYEYAIVVDYNINPIVKGKGSAICLHKKKSDKHRTFGCVAVPLSELKKILEWLDKKDNPHIYLGTF